MSEYYKSLISDDEVIQALIKESKRREGTLTTESSRIKPNLNFFQRTVNHLVSSNKRIDKSVNKLKGAYSKHPKTHTKRYSDESQPKRLPVNHACEKQLVLERKINFSKAINTEKEGKTRKPYQSSSIRKSNKSLLKYIDELSTDSSDSEAERNAISKSLPDPYLNSEYNIEKNSSKTKNLPKKYLKSDENSTSDSEPESIKKGTNDASNGTFKNIPKKYLRSECKSNDNVICISSDSNDSLKEIDTQKNHKKKKE